MKSPPGGPGLQPRSHPTAEVVDYGSRCTSRLEQLCNNVKFSDVALCVNGLKFYAHKLLLANASDVFE